MTDLPLVSAWPRTAASERGRPSDAAARDGAPSTAAGRADTGRRRPGGLAAGALLGAVCLAPLPFGSNAPLPIGVLGLVLSLGLAAAVLPRRAPQRWMLAALAALACAIGGVVALQLRPGFAPDPVWADAARRLGQPIEGGVAVVRSAPLFALGNMALCLAATALGLLVGADRRRARRLFHAIAWSALGYALIGIANAVFDPDGLLGRDRDAYAGVVLGPFVNRNTAAIYFGCGSILWATRFGAVLAEIDWRARRNGWPAWKTAAGPGLGAGLCMSAVMATGSRSGTLLSLCGLAAVGLGSMAAILRRWPPRRRTLLWAAPGALAGIALLSGATGTRFHSLGFADEGRLAVYRAVLPIVTGHPWLGTGLGTFASIYPSYRSTETGLRNLWDKAHSTPLELAAEVGLPLAIVITLAVLAALVILVRGARVRRRDADLPLAAAACLGLAAAHSCIDFSLQIPGLAVVVMALTGTGLAQAFNTGASGSEPVRDPSVRHAGPCALAAPSGTT